MSDFEKAFETFLEGCQSVVAENVEKNGFNNTPTLIYSRGRRYWKVIRDDGSQKSAHCFVDTKNGDVLKTASWKAPAKHARGNIYNDDNGLGCMGPYGAAYLRR